MKLSILIPSKRPNELAKFIDSLDRKSFTNNYEIIVNTRAPATAGQLMEECYKQSHGEWIMFANDDLIMETYGWDMGIFNLLPEDGIALLWPNDKIFCGSLSCFPIVSRRVLDAVKYFPIPYLHYKLDDTLFHIFPEEKKIYLNDIVMPHLNTDGKEGHKIDDIRIYPNDPKLMGIDNDMFVQQRDRREGMKTIIRNMINS